MERLPVNIFAGILPGSYIFLDDCSDASKWTNDASYPWTAINTGDVYGYYGKGLQFNQVQPAAAPMQSIAYRPAIQPYSSAFQFGFMLSPGGAMGYTTGLHTLYIIFNKYDNAGAGNCGHFAIKFSSIRNALPIPTQGFNISIVTGLSINFGAIAETVLAANIATILWGQDYDSPFRLWGMAQQHEITTLRINDKTVQSSPLLYSTDNFYIDPGAFGPPMIADMVAIMFDHNFAGAATSPINLDQIWISDTENRI